MPSPQWLLPSPRLFPPYPPCSGADRETLRTPPYRGSPPGSGPGPNVSWTYFLKVLWQKAPDTRRRGSFHLPSPAPSHRGWGRKRQALPPASQGALSCPHRGNRTPRPSPPRSPDALFGFPNPAPSLLPRNGSTTPPAAFPVLCFRELLFFSHPSEERLPLPMPEARRYPGSSPGYRQDLRTFPEDPPPLPGAPAPDDGSPGKASPPLAHTRIHGRTALSRSGPGFLSTSWATSHLRSPRGCGSPPGKSKSPSAPPIRTGSSPWH